MNKIIGYIIAAIGLVGLVLYGLPQLKEKLNFMDNVNDTLLLIVSGIVVLGGIFIIMTGRKKGRGGPDVPIYQGSNVVGYRRY